MSRIFLLGTGPLLEAGTSVMSGQCLRTWHFTAPLRDAAHEVSLMTVPIPNTTRDEATDPLENAHYRDFPYQKLLSNDPARITSIITREIESFKPHALVGVNAYPAFLLAELNRPEPLWADLNGWTMAEGQARAAVLAHDREFHHFWRIEAITALRADRFSTVSARQTYALLGEMAVLGRLDHRNFAEDLVCTVPNAVHPDYAAVTRRPGVPVFLNDRIPPDAHIVLWCGGFNSWTNVEMLVQGLKRAMESNPNLHFVCTGGRVHGHDELTYDRFQSLATRDLPASRCHPLGWVPYEHVLELHATAAVGLNIDGANMETRFGARNRLTNMLGAGIPVITTSGTEIAEWIERHKAADLIPPAHADGLALALQRVFRNPADAEARAAGARTKALADFAPAATLGQFREWCQAPRAALDRSTGPAPQSETPPMRLRRVMIEIADGNPIGAAGQPDNPDSVPRRLWQLIRNFVRANQ